MLDPINFVQAYHATREVHRDYARSLDSQADEKAPGEIRTAVRRPRPISWLAAVPLERRVASVLRHHA